MWWDLLFGNVAPTLNFQTIDHEIGHGLVSASLVSSWPEEIALTEWGGYCKSLHAVTDLPPIFAGLLNAGGFAGEKVFGGYSGYWPHDSDDYRKALPLVRPTGWSTDRMIYEAMKILNRPLNRKAHPAIKAALLSNNGRLGGRELARVINEARGIACLSQAQRYLINNHLD